MQGSQQLLGFKGKQVYRLSGHMVVSEVTVNGLAANYSDDGEAVTIHSPTIYGGERIIIVDGRVPEQITTSSKRVASSSDIVGSATDEIDVDQLQKKITPITTSYHPGLFGSLAFGYVVGPTLHGSVDINQPISLTMDSALNLRATVNGVSGTPALGGVDSFSRISSSSNGTNLTLAKSSAGRVFKICGFNTGSSLVRLKFYNAASISAVSIEKSKVYFSRVLPPGPFNFDLADIGWYFSSGIVYALLANAADFDSTPVKEGVITDLSVEFR